MQKLELRLKIKNI